MIILDHNIPRSETEKLRKHRIRFRQIGIHVGRPEWDDMQEILRYLHRKRGATFFTRDLGFYRATLRHRSYCMVVIDDVVTATAEIIDRSEASVVSNQSTSDGSRHQGITGQTLCLEAELGTAARGFLEMAEWVGRRKTVRTVGAASAVGKDFRIGVANSPKRRGLINNSPRS